MGYACPVCGADQPDGEHLANHVAFTAMLHGDDHEDWLDDHVEGWSDMNPDTLAPELIPHAPETDTELTTDEGAHPHGVEGELSQHGGYGRDSLSGDQQAVLEEAQELTKQMYGLDDAEDGDAADAAAPEAEQADTDSDSESQ